MDKILYIIFTLIILVVIYFAFFYFRTSKKLSKETSLEFQKILKKVLLNPSSKEKISDIDKLYHKILLSYGYVGTFGEILKQNPKIIHNINKIWELHKLRNKLAHDFDIIEEKVLIQKSKEYGIEVNNLLKNIS